MQKNDNDDINDIDTDIDHNQLWWDEDTDMISILIMINVMRWEQAVLSQQCDIYNNDEKKGNNDITSNVMRWQWW